MNDPVKSEELRDFITSTLSAITDGVAHSAHGASFHLASNVKFDVAITVTNESEAGGGLRLHIASAGAKMSAQNESVSKITFEVGRDMAISKRAIDYSSRGVV
ncbi:trypco2 family protein [Sphingomonas sp. EC-HK361]|uniref:trypco2 family protein n=1 Tax=Sphingomonas sp. EC-HK361 TaxID=2038397 RepID=UPI00125ECF14|nr:trypco2 family protein [Sphingomonas sp. EC-HK361]